MTVFTGFYTWNTGDTITAARLNTINTVVSTNGNAIDNTNIGSAGIYASQIKPDSVAHGTFAGSAGLLSPISLTANSNNDATVPLSVNGNSATQSGSLFDVSQSSGGTNVLDISAKGSLATRVTADNVVAAKFQGNSATQSADIIDAFQSNGGTQLLALGSGGDLQIAPLINALHTLARVAPVYTTAGATWDAALHIVIGTATVLNGTNSVTVALTNAARFPNVNYIAVACTNGGTGSASAVICVTSSATQIQFQLAAGNAGAGGVAINFIAIGS